ncbi:MAG: hydroxyethylthiazole kinase [Clostridiales bacterium]|nr:hydroxyethylthiazole kinase [Clostridiales bacterium]
MDYAPLTCLRREAPLVHCISNLVTIQDCANLLLAAGGRPIMAQEPQEMAEISGQCAATVLNTGTPDDRKYLSCTLAGQTANRLGHPVVLDPVGVGASAYRLEQVSHLLDRVSPTILRGNLGEVQALLRLASQESGVDCASDGGLAQRQDCALRLARALGCTVFLSGAVDVVTDGQQIALLSGGSVRMRQVTGAGCMLSVLLGGFAAVTDAPYAAALCAGAFWKGCAAYAEKQGPGMGRFHAALFDGASLLEPEQLSALCRVEELMCN